MKDSSWLNHKYLYHCTEPQNVPSILKHGLMRGGMERHTFAVYLSEKPLSWWSGGMSILRVDVSDLSEIEKTTFLPESDEILFWGDIPAYKVTGRGMISRFKDVTKQFVGKNGGT